MSVANSNRQAPEAAGCTVPAFDSRLCLLFRIWGMIPNTVREAPSRDFENENGSQADVTPPRCVRNRNVSSLQTNVSVV